MTFRFFFAAVAVFAIAVSTAHAEIKFIKPGEPSPAPVQEPDVSRLSLAEIYRGIDVLKRVRARSSKGWIIAALVKDFTDDDIDGVQGITDADRLLAASVEIARARARAAMLVIQNDLNGDGVVTKDELVIIGRTTAYGKPRRSGSNATVALTQEQRESLALEYAAGLLSKDVNGDDEITLEEATASIGAERIRTRFRTEGGALDPMWDVDSNGTITEVEIRREADTLLDLMDTNNDNVISSEELNLSRKALVVARNRAGDPSRGKRVQCTLPDVPDTEDVVVIQGSSGTAVTDLAFGIPNDPVVRMAELFVPAGDREYYVIASIRSPTVLQILGPGADRVRAVVGVAAVVGLKGGSALLTNTPCRKGFLGLRINEPGGVAAEFARALGRNDVRAMVDDRLGRVDLNTFRNETDAVLAGDDLPNMMGDGQFILDHFLSFDPGGFQVLHPRGIQSTVPVRAREVPPLEIGLIMLAADGKIDFMAPTPEFLSRKVPDGIKRVRPRADDDIAAANQRAFAHAQGQSKLTVVVRRAIDMPAGLTTERGVNVVVPDGVPKPRGLRRF